MRGDGGKRSASRAGLDHGVPGGIAQCAPALRAQIVMPLQVDSPPPGVPGAERFALATAAAQRLRPCRSSLRSLPLIDVCRHVQIHHPDYLPPMRLPSRAPGSTSLNLPRAPRGRPAGRAGVTWTGAGTGRRPRARFPGARSARRRPGPIRPARVPRAPSSAAASRRGGIAGRAAPAGVPARAPRSDAPAPAHRPRKDARKRAAPSRAA